MAGKLAPVFDGDARYRVAYGGRGSSKSWAFADMAIAYMLNNPSTPFLFARELQNSIKDSVHKLLSDRVVALGLGHLFDIGDSYFRCKNGAYGIFKGLRTNASEIKSLEGVKICWVEEAQKVSKDSLDLLIPTIRAPGSEIWFTFNPDEEDDAVYQMFVVNATPPRTRAAHINWNDNPWFPPELEEERAFMQMNSPDDYEHVWEGMCRRFAGGAIYGKLMVGVKDRGQVCPVPHVPALPVNTYWDIGFSDTLAIGFGQEVGKEPRLIDYYENNLEAIDHYIAVLQAKPYRYGVHVLPHDAGHKSLRTGKTLAQQMQDLGLGTVGKDIIVLPQDGVAAGIELVRTLLPTLWFDQAKTAPLVKALLHYQYEFDEERRVFKKTPLHDWASHPADMMRYMATYLARRKAPPVVKVQQVAYAGRVDNGAWMG